MQAQAQERYASLRDLPALTRCGTTIALQMNAGLMADLPSLKGSGAEGVGLFRTELQFLIRNKMPKRAELSTLYSRVMDSAGGKRVAFPHARHRLGQGPVLHEAQRRAEPGHGLARDPGRARQARRAADAVAGAVAGRQRAAAGGDVSLRLRSTTNSAPPRTRWYKACAREKHPRPCPARQPRDRRHAGNPEPGLRPRRLLRGGRFHLDRRQRPQAVLLCRRPRERAGAPAL